MRLSMSIKTKQIIAFAGLVALISGAMGFIAFLGSARILEKEVEVALAANALRLADSYDMWLQKQTAQMETLASNIDYSVGPKMEAQLGAEAKRLGFNSISPIDLNGIAHIPGGRTVDLSKRPYLQQVFSERKPTVSDTILSAVAGEENLLTVVVAVPVFRNGQMVGAIAGQRNAEFLSENLKTVDYGKGAANFIMNAEGFPIAHTDLEVVKHRQEAFDLVQKDPAHADLKGIIKRMASGETGVGGYKDAGKLNSIGFAPIKGRTWSVAVSVPAATVLQPLEGLRNVFLVVALLGIAVGAVFAVFLGSAFAVPLRKVSASIEEISKGDADLTRRIEMKRGDEVGKLVQSFNEFVEKLQGIMANLKKAQGSLGGIGQELTVSAHESAAATSQILANIEGVRRQSTHQAENSAAVTMAIDVVAEGVARLDRLIETQVSGNVEAAASIEQMVGNIASVTASVEKMAQRFASLMSAASDGKVKQEAVDARVKEIASQSQLLMEANEVISSIASQTNLLAMNAAIEAAHAGEAGKGFSVVADEIRRLSETSAEQSRSIGAELSRIGATITEVVDASRDSEAAFTAVTAGIEDTDELVKQIERAMSEQAEGSKQILEALRDMNEVTEEVRLKSSEMNDAAGKAKVAMDDLAQTTTTILGSMDEMGAGAEEINNAAQTVSNLAEATNANIRDMDAEIGRFTV